VRVRLSTALRLSEAVEAGDAGSECDISGPFDASAASAISGFTLSASLLLNLSLSPCLLSPFEHSSCTAIFGPESGVMQLTSSAGHLPGHESQMTMLTAATGITTAVALRPAVVSFAPAMIPTRLLKLYSIAGARLQV
jgi:hypothetical protein